MNPNHMRTERTPFSETLSDPNTPDLKSGHAFSPEIEPKQNQQASQIQSIDPIIKNALSQDTEFYEYQLEVAKMKKNIDTLLSMINTISEMQTEKTSFEDSTSGAGRCRDRSDFCNSFEDDIFLSSVNLRQTLNQFGSKEALCAGAQEEFPQKCQIKKRSTSSRSNFNCIPISRDRTAESNSSCKTDSKSLAFSSFGEMVDFLHKGQKNRVRRELTTDPFLVEPFLNDEAFDFNHTQSPAIPFETITPSCIENLSEPPFHEINALSLITEGSVKVVSQRVASKVKPFKIVKSLPVTYNGKENPISGSENSRSHLNTEIQSQNLESRVKTFKMIKTENYMKVPADVKQNNPGLSMISEERDESQSDVEDEYSKDQDTRESERAVNSITNSSLSNSTADSPNNAQQNSESVNILSSCTATVARSLGRFLKLEQNSMASKFRMIIQEKVLQQCQKITMEELESYLETNFKKTQKTNKKYLMQVIGDRGFLDSKENVEENEEMKRAVWTLFQIFLDENEDYYKYWVREIYQPRQKSDWGSTQEKNNPEKMKRDLEKRRQYIAYRQEIKECFTNPEKRKKHQLKKSRTTITD